MTVPAFPREHLLGALRKAAKFKDHSQRIVILQKWEVEDILLAWDAKHDEAERLFETLNAYEAYDITVASALNDRDRVRVLEAALRLAIEEYVDDCYCGDERDGGRCVNCRIRAALAEVK